MKLAASVLAAGRSVRFGGQKISATLCEKELVCFPIEDLKKAGIKDVLVILSPGIDHSRISCFFGVHKAINVGFGEGIASSIRLSVNIVKGNFTHLLITNGDMPLFGWKNYSAMVNLSRTNSSNIVAAFSNGVFRNPAIFPERYFAELSSLTGEDGGRTVLNRHRNDLIPYEIEDPNEVRDIDTPEDLNEVSRIMCHRPSHKM